MGSDSFGTRDRLTVDDTAYQIYRLDRIDGSQRLPYSLNVLLENLLRQHTWPSTPVTVVEFADGTSAEVDNGHVVIAAITSCTNTSNPSVMVGAALLAKKAVEKDLSRKRWVKTSLAPGSRVVTDYYQRAGLTPYLDKLGFNLVGYGCTTCIGNSGPLTPECEQGGAGQRPDRLFGAVGQPQFRRPHPPGVQDELPCLPTAGRRLRARRQPACQPARRSAGHRQRR